MTEEDDRPEADRSPAGDPASLDDEPALDDPGGLDSTEGGPGAPDRERSERRADRGVPLDELADSVDERRERVRERPDDELFAQEEVDEIDTEVVWERLEDDESPAELEDGREDVRVVEKASYCERCPFFSAPPTVACAHEGTEIVELVDMDHFRVVDCPKVHEAERLEKL